MQLRLQDSLAPRMAVVMAEIKPQSSWENLFLNL